MYAFPAAKRTLVLVMGLALLVVAAVAQADDDGDEGYLGVMLQDVSPSMAKALQMGDKSGVMINEVIDDGPAEKAGIEDGDVILEFNGQTIAEYKDLTKAVRATSPGDKVEVVVLRGGKTKTIDVEIGKNENEDVFFMSKDGDIDVRAPHFKHFDTGDANVWVMRDDDDDVSWTMDMDHDFVFDSDRGFLGVHLDDLEGQLGEYFGVEDGNGALVTEVVEDSPAAKAGLKAGDVIVKVGSQDVDSAKAVHKALADTEPDQQMAVEVVRKGKKKEVSVTLGEMPENEFAKRMEFIGDDDDHFTIRRAPHMMMHSRDYGDRDVDVRVIRRDAEGELKEMREELHKMQQELKKMQEELDK